MIKLFRAALLIHVHASSVKLEHGSLGINGNGNGSNCGKCDLQGLLVPLDVDESNVLSSLVGVFVPAFPVLGLVRVALLGVDAVVLLDVVKSIVHKAALASIIAKGHGAIDQVLFAKADELSSFAEKLAFQSPSGRKGPARSTVALVLHGGHGSVISPVNGLGHGKVGGRDEGRSDKSRLVLHLEVVAVHQPLELVGQEVAETVHLEMVGVVALEELGVVLGDGLLVLQVDLEAELLLGRMLVFLA